MIKIGRPINGISLNGLEYLMTKDGKKEKEFADKEKAKQFLRKNGHKDWTDDELEDSYMFVDIEKTKKLKKIQKENSKKKTVKKKAVKKEDIDDSDSDKKSCDNCGSTNGYNNSSDEFQCENCGHSETE